MKPARWAQASPWLWVKDDGRVRCEVWDDAQGNWKWRVLRKGEPMFWAYFGAPNSVTEAKREAARHASTL